MTHGEITPDVISRTIVALGDSTTAGTPLFTSPLEAPPDGRGDERSQYAYWLMQAHPDWRVLNRGVNGERSDQILARFDRDVLAHQPDVVVIVAGVNDVYQGRDAIFTSTNLRAMYDRALSAGIRVVAGTILPFNAALPLQNVKMEAINAWISAQTTRDGRLTMADTRLAVARAGNIHLLDGSPDGVHPDIEGYRRMAAAIDAAVSQRPAAT